MRIRPGLRAAVFAAAFVAVHAVLSAINILDVHRNPAGDVRGVYLFWVDYWHTTGQLVGIDTAWVYPIGALPPMLLADLFGPVAYLTTWLVLVSLLDGVASVLLYRRRASLAWWWLGFTALLGPVALSRIDGVALPIAVLGVLAVADRPWLASALLTLAAWVKVWPAAVVVALVVSGRRTASVVAAAAVTTAAVIGIALAAGARSTLFSFLGAQATRGLQIEAPGALPWLWPAAIGDPTVQIYYDTGILTYQLRGAGVAAMAGALTPALVVGVLAVLGLAIAARIRGADPGTLLALTATGLVAAVIALNKVGSPQYLTWIVAPVLLGLLADPLRFRAVAAVALIGAGLTQLIYPWTYADLLAARPGAVALLTLRNVLEVALLGWSAVELARLRAPAAVGSALREPVASV